MLSPWLMLGFLGVLIHPSVETVLPRVVSDFRALGADFSSRRYLVRKAAATLAATGLHNPARRCTVDDLGKHVGAPPYTLVRPNIESRNA